MEDAVTCAICSELYQRGPKEPLVLPCGHTFCRTCLNKVFTTSLNWPTCPTCRKEIGDLEHLPICFPLLSLSSEYGEFKYQQCREHSDEQRFWCEECQRPLCSLCLYSAHPPGHQVLPARAAMETMRLGLREELEGLREEVRGRRRELQDLARELVSKTRQVCKVDNAVERLSTAVHNACCLDDVLICQDTLGSIKEERAEALTKEALNTGRRSVVDFDNLYDMVPEKTEEAAHTEQELRCQERGRRGESGIPALYARLDSQEGRLLLDCLARPATTNLSLQLPSEVYLELSAGGRRLGRVYIRLWCHLRRAHQFLALCLGTLGPSYLGASFSHVAYLNQPKETLCCKEYLRKDRSSGTKELISDLEWGGEYAKSPVKGLVIPLSKNVHEHGFGICTRSQPNGIFHCPFGEVVSGLNVVKLAIRQEPVSEVSISQCGIVVPDI